MEDITLTNETIEQYHQRLNGQLRKEINMWKDNEEYQRNRANSIEKLFLKEKEKNEKLEQLYRRVIRLLEDIELLPCEICENHFDCTKCNYCQTNCSNGNDKCWENFIENCYQK